MLLLALLACGHDADPTQDTVEDSGTGDSAPADSGDDTSGDTGDRDTGGDTGEPQVNRWNVLVYMDGDNSLESYVTHDLNELEEAGSGDGVTVLVQADRIDGLDTTDGDWTGTRRYLITADDDGDVVSSQVLEDLGELDMGDPATLADFIAWADTTYPAEHTALSLWDHGDGWAAADAPPPPPHIATDDTSGSSLSISGGDLRAALQAHADTVGPIDLLAFDACNMGTWEVADSLRGQVHTMVASEAWVGNDGIMYAPMVRYLREDPSLTSGDLGVLMSRDSVYEGNEFTYSATDIDAIADLTTQVDLLAAWALSDLAKAQTVIDARDASRGADVVWDDFFHDLGDMADVIVADPEAPPDLAKIGAGIRASLDAAVLEANGNQPYEWSNGLTIYFGLGNHVSLVQYHTGEGAT